MAEHTIPVAVLLVDDDPLMLELARDMLDGIRPGGYRVTWASHYEEGLEALVSGAHDVCLLDHNLGGRTGIDMLREAVGRGASTPVVMITGHKDPKTDMEAMAVGAAEYMVKGEITASLLERTVRYTLSKSQAEARLRISEERFRSLAENTAEGIITIDTEDQVTYANEGAARIFGRPVDEILTLPFTTLLPERYRERHRQGIAHYLATGERRIPWNGFELPGLRGDGTEVPLEITFGEHTIEGRRYFSGVIRDITERKRAEATLRESEESYRTLFNSVREAIYIQDPDGRFIDVNDPAADLYGYSREEIIGQTPELLAAEGRVDLERTARYAAEALAGRPQRFEWWGRRRNGEEFPKEVSLSRGTYFGREVVIAVARDITERQMLEEQLRQAQKIEAVGRLAGGIAHDFNNLLTGILGHTDFVLQDLPPDSPLRGDLEEVRRNGERARDLTRQLLAFSRKQVLQSRVLDMDRMVRSVEALLRRVISADVEIAIEIDAPDACVEADPGQIEQLIVNLGMNGSDAMPDGGRITLRVGATRVSPGEAAAYPFIVRPGPYVTLEVIDTGVGMTPDVKEHMFEPFFTTKGPGKGTGLGLAMVYGIVKQSGGFINVESEPREGTRFVLYFPRVEREATPVVDQVSTPAVSKGSGETVLLVEDELGVRLLGRKILMRKGYTVLEAATPAEALDEVVPGYPGTIDLLITDVVMPGMNGHEMAEKIRALRPRMRVMYISGYTEDEVARRGIEDAGRRFLPKPFSPTQLAERVREVLDDTTQ